MKRLTLTIAFISSLAMISCQTEIDLNDAIDQNSSFTLTIKTVDKETGLSTTKTKEIEVESDKWNKLVDFAKNNLNGWTPSPASFSGDIYVSQGDFRLIYLKGTDGVVINFTDNNNETKQYSKQIDKGELDFLIE